MENTIIIRVNYGVLFVEFIKEIDKRSILGGDNLRNTDDNIGVLHDVFSGTCQTILSKYLKHVEGYCSWQKVDGEDPDEKFMNSIEKYLDLTDNAKRAFREEILIRLSTFKRRDKTFTVDSYRRLGEAIERFVLTELQYKINEKVDIRNLSLLAKEISDDLNTGSISAAKTLIDELYNSINKIEVN